MAHMGYKRKEQKTHLAFKVYRRRADQIAVVVRLLHRRHWFAAHHFGVRGTFLHLHMLCA